MTRGSATKGATVTPLKRARSSTSDERPKQEAGGPPAGVTLETVEVERLAAHPLQPRKDLGDLTELINSIREYGVLQPIVALPDPTGTGRLYMLLGHRRREAAVRAGLAEVPVLVRHDQVSDARQLVAMLAENVHRNDLSPVEESDAYEQLRLLDYTPKQIAQELGRHRSTVDRRLALRKLPLPVRERLHAGQVTLGDADMLVEFATDADVTGRLVDQLGTPNFRYTVETERRRREARAGVAKRIKAAAAAGIAVLRPKTRDWEWDPPVDGVPAALNRLDVDDGDEHHATCPGRALVVYSDDTQAVRACTEPSRHGLFTDGARGAATSTAAAAGGEETRRTAAERADAQRQLLEELSAAADARDAWIREELLSASVRPAQVACTVMLRQALLAELEMRDGARELAGGRAGDLLGLPFDRGDDPDSAAAVWGERFVVHLEAAPLERLVQIAWALLLGSDVGRLATPYAWSGDYSGPAAARHLADLQALGYSPCDVETRMLAEQAEPAAPGADG